MGDEAEGVYSAGWYAAGLETPDNEKFVAGINADNQHDPGFYTAGPYTALLIIEAALGATAGKIDDAAAFLKAMHDVRLRKRADRPGPARRIRHAGPRHLHSPGGAGTESWSTPSSRPIRKSASSGPTIPGVRRAAGFSRDFPPGKYLE